MLYLCLDQGGHASRALVLDEQGTVITRAVREVATQTPAPDRVEQDPEAVVTSLRDAANAAVDELGARADDIVAAGLATQRSSIVCWDRLSGVALSPVISWQDRRAHAWLTQFETHALDIETRTGLRLSAHYGASKLRWCLDHLDAARRARDAGRLMIGPLASFLAFKLAAQRPCLIDPSNAQRTLLWNLATRDWDPPLLDLFAVPRDCLPTCTSTRADFGALSVGTRAFPFTILTGDQAAALFAFGMPDDDVASINLGTGAFVQRVVRTPRRLPGLLTGIALDDQGEAVYTLEATVNGAGAALAWAAQELGVSAPEENLSTWLVSEHEPPLFLNGIGGLGAPYWRADFASRFVGEGTPSQKIVAVAESIVFLLATNLERLREIGALRALVLTGGLARSDALCQSLVDLAGVTARRPDEHEATARGTAWLLAGARATWSAGNTKSFPPKSSAHLQDRYERWCVALRAALG